MIARLREAILWAGAAVGALVILGAVALAVTGGRVLVFESGSMSPAIEAGAIGVTRSVDAGQVEVGDVVSVESSSGQRVTHRVVSTSVVDDTATLILKGDTNNGPDDEIYRVSSVDRVVLDVPYLGYAVVRLFTPAGLLLALLICAAVFWAGLESDRSAVRTRTAVTLAVLGLIAAPLSAGQVRGTVAAFTDNAAARTGTLTSHKVASQAQPTCTDATTLAGNIARLTWPQVNTRYEYAWEVRESATGTVRASGTVGTGVAAGSTVTLDIGPAGLANGSFNVVVRARLASSTTWVASTSTTTPIARSTVIIVSSVRCA